jgi:hypothetical protein
MFLAVLGSTERSAGTAIIAAFKTYTEIPGRTGSGRSFSFGNRLYK